jgi:molecular chaperone DnaK
MVKDAEAHAAEDKKFHELVAARNQADALIHASEKSMKELGDKLEAGERSSIEAAINDLQAVIKTDNVDAIETKTKALSEASAKMAERLYAQKGQEGGAQPGAQSADAGAKNDDVVDAEFEEVDEKKG